MISVWHIKEIRFSLILIHSFQKLGLEGMLSTIHCTCFSLESPYVKREVDLA